MKIPYEDYPGGEFPLHFAHANGYPPIAYRSLLKNLSQQYHVFAMCARPLWPTASTNDLHDWKPLADDLTDFLDQHHLNNLIGVGHSMGATTTLRLALRQPSRFYALVLIDPVLFPPWIVLQWDLIYRLGLGYHLHPLVNRAKKRRNSFQSREEMFENYRKKSVFKRMDDDTLQAYVDALACGNPGSDFELCYSPSWEARIYVTGVRADMDIWKGLHRLSPPLLIIRGAETKTFWKQTASLVKLSLPQVTINTIPNATHLVPLEQSAKVTEMILSFLESISH
jgi:pimeloyl-ACP methyl ester carboxylesterase